MSRMKIVVGMGAIDDYLAFAEAGADEIFVGYVPYRWVEKYGVREALNRREVLYYNVQIGSFSELLILKDMVSSKKVPVTIAFNSLHFLPEAYPDVLEILEECMQAGFAQFIIADPELLAYLAENCNAKYIVSGECTELNQKAVEELKNRGGNRIIFPRQTTIQEMDEMISRCPDLEYEAFVLNEKCHFTGAYCNSMHCDELCHMCKVPYQFEGKLLEEAEEKDVLGATGCGLCALWKLKEAGVTHLKIVSRGNSGEETYKDIKALQSALDILEASKNEEEYIAKMKRRFFPNGCGGECYYGGFPDDFIV